MSSLKDVRELIIDFKENYGKLNKSKMTSLSKMSSDGVMQFPLLISKNISSDNALIISKALERQYVSFVRVVLSVNGISGDATNPKEFIRKFHQNFDNSGSTSDTISSMVKSIGESTGQSELSEGMYGPRGNFNDSHLYDLIESTSTLSRDDLMYINECINIQQIMTESIEELSEKEFVTMRDIPRKHHVELYNILKPLTENSKIYKHKNMLVRYNKADRVVSDILFESVGDKIIVHESAQNIYEKSLLESSNYSGLFQKGNKRLLEAYESDLRVEPLNKVLSEARGDRFSNNSGSNTNHNYNRNQNTNNNVNQTKNMNNHTINVTNSIEDKSGGRPLEFKTIGDNRILTDQDIKKANELTPTILPVRTVFYGKDGQQTSFDYLIGVKVIMHPIDSMDMVDNLVRGVKRNRNFFNFVRWTTGEISFFKDFVFTLDDIKRDVYDKMTGKSIWWNALRRRQALAKLKKNVFLQNQMVPNASIVITMEEAEYIKSEHGIDFRKSLNNVKELMAEYYLLAFVIVDIGSEMAYLLFDGERDFQTFSFDALQRESGSDTKQVREIMKVMGRM